MAAQSLPVLGQGSASAVLLQTTDLAVPSVLLGFGPEFLGQVFEIKHVTRPEGRIPEKAIPGARILMSRPVGRVPELERPKRDLVQRSEARPDKDPRTGR